MLCKKSEVYLEKYPAKQNFSWTRTTQSLISNIFPLFFVLNQTRLFSWVICVYERTNERTGCLSWAKEIERTNKGENPEKSIIRQQMSIFYTTPRPFLQRKLMKRPKQQMHLARRNQANGLLELAFRLVLHDTELPCTLIKLNWNMQYNLANEWS